MKNSHRHHFCFCNYCHWSSFSHNRTKYFVFGRDTSRPKDNLLSIHSGLNPEIMRNERVKSFVMNENLAKSNSTYRHEI